MKAFFLIPLLVLLLIIVQHIRVAYIYDRDIGDYWVLADKTSTIQKKSEYIDLYVAALDRSGAMHGHNALFLRTPNNDLEQNMIALRSLQDRLHQIKGMDVQNFAYQQAIQQITAQEQGEAHELTSTLYGGWVLNSGYWYLWNWMGGVIIVLLIGTSAIALSLASRRMRSRASRR